MRPIKINYADNINWSCSDRMLSKLFWHYAWFIYDFGVIFFRSIISTKFGGYLLLYQAGRIHRSGYRGHAHNLQPKYLPIILPWLDYFIELSPAQQNSWSDFFSPITLQSFATGTYISGIVYIISVLLFYRKIDLVFFFLLK